MESSSRGFPPAAAPLAGGRGARGKGRVAVCDVNDHVTCRLCDGYLVDATTITRCLHSFCRSCIVRHLSTENGRCPLCDPADPLNIATGNRIRRDRILQRLVYKLVPGLLNDELKRRNDFNNSNRASADALTADESRDPSTSTQQPGCSNEQIDKPQPSATQSTTTTAAAAGGTSASTGGDTSPLNPLYTGLETFNICLKLFQTSSLESSSDRAAVDNRISSEDTLKPRFLLCPALVTVNILKKFLRIKFDLKPATQVEIVLCGEILDSNYSLVDLVYIFNLPPNEPLTMDYVIRAERDSSIPRSSSPVVQDNRHPSAEPTADASPHPSGDQLQSAVAMETTTDAPSSGGAQNESSHGSVTSAGKENEGMQREEKEEEMMERRVQQQREAEGRLDETVAAPKKKRGRKPKRRRLMALLALRAEQSLTAPVSAVTQRPEADNIADNDNSNIGRDVNVDDTERSASLANCNQLPAARLDCTDTPTDCCSSPTVVVVPIKKKRGRKPKPRPEVTVDNAITPARIVTNGNNGSRGARASPKKDATSTPTSVISGSGTRPTSKQQQQQETDEHQEQTLQQQQQPVPVRSASDRKRKSSSSSPENIGAAVVKLAKISPRNGDQVAVWKVTSPPEVEAGVIPRLKVTNIVRLANGGSDSSTNKSTLERRKWIATNGSSNGDGDDQLRGVRKPMTTRRRTRMSFDVATDVARDHDVRRRTSTSDVTLSDRVHNKQQLQQNPVPVLERASQWIQTPVDISGTGGVTLRDASWNGPVFPAMQAVHVLSPSKHPPSSTPSVVQSMSPMLAVRGQLKQKKSAPKFLAAAPTDVQLIPPRFSAVDRSPRRPGYVAPTALAVADGASEVMFVVGSGRDIDRKLNSFPRVDLEDVQRGPSSKSPRRSPAASSRRSTDAVRPVQLTDSHGRSFVTQRVSVQKDGTVMLDQRGDSVVLVSTIPSAFILTDKLTQQHQLQQQQRTVDTSTATTVFQLPPPLTTQTTLIHDDLPPTHSNAVQMASPDRRSEDCFEITSTVADEPPQPSTTPSTEQQLEEGDQYKRLVVVGVVTQKSSPSDFRPTSGQQTPKHPDSGSDAAADQIGIDRPPAELLTTVKQEPVVSPHPTAASTIAASQPCRPAAALPAKQKKSLEMVVSSLLKRPQQTSTSTASTNSAAERPSSVTSQSTTSTRTDSPVSACGSVPSIPSLLERLVASPPHAPPYDYVAAAASHARFRSTLQTSNSGFAAAGLPVPPINQLKNMCSNVQATAPRRGAMQAGGPRRCWRPQVAPHVTSASPPYPVGFYQPSQQGPPGFAAHQLQRFFAPAPQSFIRRASPGRPDRPLELTTSASRDRKQPTAGPPSPQSLVRALLESSAYRNQYGGGAWRQTMQAWHNGGQ